MKSTGTTPLTQYSSTPRDDLIELDNSETGKAARKAYFRANSLCIYCGKSGHVVATCSVLFPLSPRSNAKNHEYGSERCRDSCSGVYRETKQLDMLEKSDVFLAKTLPQTLCPYLLMLLSHTSIPPPHLI